MQEVTITRKPKSFLNLDPLKMSQMSDLETKLFVALAWKEFMTGGEKTYGGKTTGAEIPENFPFLSRLLLSRLMWAKSPVEVTEEVLLLLGAISKVAGIAVEWAWTLHNMYQRDPKKITLGVLSEHFEVGFPKYGEKETEEIWEDQKIMAIRDNALDYIETWKME